MNRKKTKIKKDFFKTIRGKQSDTQNTGITLISLIITVIVLLILAGVAISTVIGNGGLLSKSKTSVEVYSKEQAKEKLQMYLYDIKMDIIATRDTTAKDCLLLKEKEGIEKIEFISKGSASATIVGGEITDPEYAMVTCFSFTFKVNSKLMIVSEEETGGSIIGEPLSASNINKVRAKIASDTAIEVNYTPKTTASTVTIPSANNDDFDAIDGNEGVDDQVFSQANLNATGNNAVKWYLLNVDEAGATLVSEPTSSSKSVTFKGWEGYANCLYYLNQIASNLFSNSDIGATAHALRLTDIRDATKVVNNWSDSDWQINFINNAINKTLNLETSLSGGAQYPNFYGTSTGDVTINNPMYDEEIGETGIPMSTGEGVTASTLIVNGTFFGYYNYSAEDKGVSNQLDKLGNFGDTGIAEELFNASDCDYWIASHSMYAISSDIVDFGLRRVRSGCLTDKSLASSSGEVGSPSYAIRAVVKVPASHVSVSQEGIVSII